MSSVHDVAAAVIAQLGGITAMKLEKLVYYCQGWHLARHGVPLFDEPIEAWRQGPVVPALFRQHRRQRTVSAWPSGDSGQLTPAQRETVDWVTIEYGKFSAIELSQMTHSELPWRVARGTLPDSARSTAQLSTSIMRNYYSRQLADPETAVALATANAALEGVEFDDEWQDRLRDVASGLVSADDLIAAEIARITGG
ncbi:Panacea domain-containing protein [Paractinoplanes durhamensis]|uniref:Antitoxin SocA-like Panacea domain-containing protein n=1 Tax=Paractinoplanes durhamensis TaxID=113563 RepID=A0ABQ3YXA2_9ACTN|nr:type II toxin-antitoxin system antitoxin SocA domain-containing protein [Actinoplanes durhamensis]GIE02181.1 hypothetical protein Adu01nite_35310 [Actinoplanes durhamensis]